MRPLVGLNPRPIARRSITVDRLATISLYRNRHADPPGSQLNLSIGERTSYRAAAHILDQFDRDDGALGSGYSPWVTPTGFTGLVIASELVQPAGNGVDIEQFETHSIVLPRDQWAEVTIRALTAAGSGSYASAGVVLRASPPDGTGRAYVAVASDDGDTRKTRLGRLRDGDIDWIAESDTPWRVGDVLRATAYWSLLRVYRNGVLILQHTDIDPLLVGGRAGVEAIKLVSGDAASLNNFIAGPLRQEYLGRALDIGDASTSLGLVEPSASPVSFDLTIRNFGKIGGVDRFARLIRQGRNTGGYDQFKSDVRVLADLEGGSAAISVACGVINGLTDMTEESVRVQCQGLDAVLEPNIEIGQVIYLGGSPPSISGPPTLPEDCAAAPTPVVEPGDTPEEPEEDEPVEGAGPESPPEEDDGEPEDEEPEDGGVTGPLLGGYAIRLVLRHGDPGADPPEDEWVTETTVVQLPDTDFWPPECNVDAGQFVGGEPALGGPVGVGGLAHLDWTGNPDTTVGVIRAMTMYYRGPDVVGDVLTVAPTDMQDCLGESGQNRLIAYGQVTVPSPATIATDHTVSWTGRLAHFDPSGIHTVEDLQALRLATPAELGDYEAALPARIETLVEWSGSVMGTGSESANAVTDPLDSGASIPLNQFAGPQLIGIELVSFGGSGHATESGLVVLETANAFGGTGRSPSVGTP